MAHISQTSHHIFKLIVIYQLFWNTYCLFLLPLKKKSVLPEVYHLISLFKEQAFDFVAFLCHCLVFYLIIYFYLILYIFYYFLSCIFWGSFYSFSILLSWKLGLLVFSHSSFLNICIFKYKISIKNYFSIMQYLGVKFSCKFFVVITIQF